jgi:hypothetical protein
MSCSNCSRNLLANNNGVGLCCSVLYWCTLLCRRRLRAFLSERMHSIKGHGEHSKRQALTNSNQHQTSLLICYAQYPQAPAQLHCHCWPCRSTTPTNCCLPSASTQQHCCRARMRQMQATGLQFARQQQRRLVAAAQPSPSSSPCTPAPTSRSAASTRFSATYAYMELSSPGGLVDSAAPAFMGCSYQLCSSQSKHWSRRQEDCQ